VRTVDSHASASPLVSNVNGAAIDFVVPGWL
jgi:hypothetical protein